MDARTGLLPMLPTAPPVEKCPLHPKPQLVCKFCRKHKNSLLQAAILKGNEINLQNELNNLLGGDGEQENSDVKLVPVTNTTTYNVNALLRENILHSEYYKSLFVLDTPRAVCEEIRRFVEYAEPYLAGHQPRVPSTFLCCLYRLLTMRLREEQLQSMLDDSNVFVKCAALVYLRYLLPPEQLLDWYKHLLLDDEPFSPSADKTKVMYVDISDGRELACWKNICLCRTVGEFAESLITDDRRKLQNKKNLEAFEPEVPVAVCSSKGEWLEAYVVRLEEFSKGQMCCEVRLKNDPAVTELVDLGLVILLEAKSRQEKRREERAIKRSNAGMAQLDYTRKRRRKLHSSKDDRNYSRKRPQYSTDEDYPGANDLTEGYVGVFKERERQKAVASGTAYARRPASYKTALSQRFVPRRRDDARSSANHNVIVVPREPAATTYKGDQEKQRYLPETSDEYKQKLAKLTAKYTSSSNF